MDEEKRVIVIDADPERVRAHTKPKYLRVAAYCRVSTDKEDQVNSYEAQKQYYTELIHATKGWMMAGIFADEGLTGTSVKKREHFQKMIRKCEQHQIDLILVKSISRFARNTVDCLAYTRDLRRLDVDVFFEKENLHTIKESNEFLLALHGAFAQQESESISANVRWGQRQAMREGKANIVYCKLFAYEKGADGEPQIVPKEAQTVRMIYERYLSGDTMQNIARWLIESGKPYKNGKPWSFGAVRGILLNEFYCGDVLRQKTFCTDCISKRVVKNDGQLPKYLIQNHHAGIVSREEYDAVQAELARRSALKSCSKRASTHAACYKGKYALTYCLICGECGTPYSRCVWSKRGKRKVVWRCTSRLNDGTKYCHHSPSIEEGALQEAILRAINSKMSSRETLIREIGKAMRLELIPLPGQSLTLADIDRRLEELGREFQTLLEQAAGTMDTEVYSEAFRKNAEEARQLKMDRQALLEQQAQSRAAHGRAEHLEKLLTQASPELKHWNENVIHQIIDSVTVDSAEQITVRLKDGTEIVQEVMQAQ